MRYILMWTDRDGEPHVRLLEGQASEADEAMGLLRRKYAITEGVFNERVVEVDGDGFVGISVIREEFGRR